MSLAEVTAVVKSCVLSKKEDTTVDALEDDYYDLTGERMPFKKLGFHTVNNLLEALPGIEVVTNLHSKSIVRAASEKAAHISNLVRKQKVVQKKKKQSWYGPKNIKNHFKDLGSTPGHPRKSFSSRRTCFQTPRVNLEEAIAEELARPRSATQMRPFVGMIYGGFLSYPAEPSGIHAVENNPSSIFDVSPYLQEYQNLPYPQEELRSRRGVTGSGENLRVTVKSDYKASSEVSFEDDNHSWAKIVLESMPVDWQPRPCVWETYILGDDFSIPFVAEEMKCGYTGAEIPSSGLCFRGFTISDGYEFMKSLGWVPARIFVMLGYIDILNGHRLEHIKQDMSALVKFLAEHANQVGVCTLPFLASTSGCNRQILHLNVFLNSLECDRVSVIDCCSVFNDHNGCIDELCYETKPICLFRLQQPVKMWNDIGKAALYAFLFKKMRDLFVKSIGL